MVSYKLVCMKVIFSCKNLVISCKNIFSYMKSDFLTRVYILLQELSNFM